ncbi:MAG: EAL domain-containing protein [Azoarcus sp.]|jgi:diguanylate cyclase (GGDEF)-like protein/PAS domain S-box-containing protein|nr:EAL domain-containing protein [Azoarcus sp.]
MEKQKLAATLQKRFYNDSYSNVILSPAACPFNAVDIPGEDLYPEIVEQASSAIVLVDGKDRVVLFNPAAGQLWGRSKDEVVGASISQLMPPMKDGHTPGQSEIDHLVGHNVELPIERPNNTRVWAEISVSRIQAMGKPMRLIIAKNITLSKVHKAFRYQVLRAMAQTDSLLEIMTLLCQEIQRIAPEISATVTQIDGEGRLRSLVAPDFPQHTAALIDGIEIGPKASSQAIAAFRGEPVLVRDIEHDPGWSVGRRETLALGYKACWSAPIKTRDGRTIGILTFYYRVCRRPNNLHARLAEIAVSLCVLAMERAASFSRIHHLAFFDDLTGLPNRSLLHIQASQAIAHAARNNERLAVLFIDIDRFKKVNDSLGHPAGDTLLRTVASRLREATREVDILGRYSGDEFIVVLTQCDSVHASELAGRLLVALSAPCRIGEVTLMPAASIGISLFPDNGRDMDALIHEADTAMYQAKQKGRGCFSFFSGQLNQIAKERLTLETALRDALSGNELEIYYQPQINIETHQLHGIEALVRWNSSQLGEIAPGRFIPLAEESNLISPLSQWVLNEACRQLAQWRQHDLAIPSVSVNLSPTDFHNLNLKLPQYLEAILRSHGLQPSDLLIEITEGVLMDSNPDTMRTLHEIHALGVRLSIDDFGTGYSSLGYLRHLPVHELKLDQSFVRDLNRDRATRALTNAVMHIGDSMELTVIAEGVEHPTQRNLLKAQGYQVVQGFLFSPPLPPTALERWLDENLSFTHWE